MKPEAVVIFTLWYYPSHFGLHVDDIADAFATSGIDVRIVTVAEEVYRHHYFDPFRHMFVSDFLERYPVYRLKTLDIADRGLFPPIVVPSLPVDLEAWVLSSARRKPAAIFHFFEHFAWRFNQEAYPEFQATTLYYAGNFVNRILQMQLDEGPRPGRQKTFNLLQGALAQPRPQRVDSV